MLRSTPSIGTVMSQLTLVSHHLCPYVQRAAIALLEKGVPFRRVMVDLAAKPDWFTALSPLGNVPLLRVSRSEGGEAILFESTVICEYIEETQPGPALHPSDPLERARHRGWMEFGSAILGDIWGLETAIDADLFETKRRALRDKLARVELVLADGPFFAGNASAWSTPYLRRSSATSTCSIASRILGSSTGCPRWRPGA